MFHCSFVLDNFTCMLQVYLTATEAIITLKDMGNWLHESIKKIQKNTTKLSIFYGIYYKSAVILAKQELDGTLHAWDKSEATQVLWSGPNAIKLGDRPSQAATLPENQFWLAKLTAYHWLIW